MVCPISTVTYPSGSTKEKTTVCAVAQHGDEFIVIASKTPFHPRDYQWPDQPEDKGHIDGPNGQRYRLSDAVFVAVSPEGIFSVGDEIPVKKNTPGWGFVVGHVIEGDRPSLAAGDEITLQVDEVRRSALSRAHAAVHLMSLALNRAFAPLWKKNPAWLDSFGNPNFDQIAMERSEIGLLEVADTYRLGKSLRKKGFSPQGLSDELGKYADAVNIRLAEWIASDSPVSIRTEGDFLTSYRHWTTTLEGTDVEIPCGGTTVSRLSEIGEAGVVAEMSDESTLIIRTYVR